MKCPWREYVYVQKNGMGYVYRDVEWKECYKEECPFFLVNSYMYTKTEDGETEVMKDGRCERVGLIAVDVPR